MKVIYVATAIAALSCCSGSGTAQTGGAATGSEAGVEQANAQAPRCNADSAYSYVERQVNFGPRVPNTSAHREAGLWLKSELERHGATVIEQAMELTTFDGVKLQACNIMGQYNPQASYRVLLLAHWDCRPWADADPNEANRRKPVPGANDGASGVGLLLEIARTLQATPPPSQVGVDILFVDAEDWGTDGDDSSWALGTRYFAQNPIKSGYRVAKAVLLDMVGGQGAQFRREYFSDRYARSLVNEVWGAASQVGADSHFSHDSGGAITDDHVELLQAGIPAIDVIEFADGTGFNPRWHTLSDDMSGISAATLKAVGDTMLQWIFNQNN
jgi:Zn-dependent M28 family amino/carboxypeptidase